MDQIKPVAKLSSLPPWQNYRVNRLSDSIGAIEKLFTMTKFPPVCLLVLEALRPVSRGSQWHLFSPDIIPGDIVLGLGVMQWSRLFPARCLPPDWLVTTLHTSDGGAGAGARGPHLVRRSSDRAPPRGRPGHITSGWSLTNINWTSSSSFIVGI